MSLEETFGNLSEVFFEDLEDVFEVFDFFGGRDFNVVNSCFQLSHGSGPPVNRSVVESGSCGRAVDAIFRDLVVGVVSVVKTLESLEV